MKWICNGQKWLCVYYQLSDDYLLQVRQDARFYRDEDLVVRLLGDRGENAHIFGLFHNGGDYKEILVELRKIRKEYKTVSWWNRRYNRFFIKRGI